MTRRRQLRFGPGVAGIADAGTSPGIGLGLEVGLHWQWRALRSELSGVWLPPRRGLVAGFADVGGSVQLLALVVRECALARAEAWAGGACAAFELGRLQAQSFGAADDGSGDSTWLAPALGLMAGYSPWRGLSLRARLEALVPLQRSEFFVENAGSVHTPSAFVGRFSLGVDADFW